MTGSLAQAISILADPYVLFIIAVASFYGLFIGAIPGLTATMATALLIPLTFFMDPLPALAAIVTMEAMAIFSGDIPATLVRIPGTPSSAAYTQDSYELTKRGHAELALGVDLVFSVIGGLMGAIVLIVAAPLLAEFAMKFTTFEYFWLATLGLSASVMVSRGSLIKGAFSLLFGLALSTVGVDITLGLPRFTFDNVELLNGINFIPAMIGLFGISEVLRNVSGKQLAYPIASVKASKIFTGMWSLMKRYKVNTVRSGIIGTVVGILPGAGADIAAWITYAVAKKFSKEPEKFGRGHIEPLIDAGTANNSALAGAWVPALVFGIPGDSITAIVIGVLFMQGLRPGPMIFERQPEIVYAVYMTFILANLLMIPFGYLAIKFSSSMIRMPRNILMPIILIFSLVGAFAINNTIFDVGVMLVMGIIGYFMETHDIPVAPAILGIVLGPIVEENFMVSMIKTQWDFTQFFSRPISAVLCLMALLVWFFPFIMGFLQRGLQITNQQEPNKVK
jgi:putative tricarboxylic transport membrane protein